MKPKDNFDVHREHSKVGWYAGSFGLYISPDFREVKLIDYGKRRSSRSKDLTLECNLSNHGCTSRRRVRLDIRVVKAWRPR